MNTAPRLHQRRTARRRTARRSRAGRRRGCSRRRTAPAARRASRPAGRCRAPAGRPCRRRSPACRRPRRRWTAACRCCRSRRCRGCGRGPRGCPGPTCPRCPSCIRWVFSGQPAGQRDDLAEHQLDDAAGVGERRVEHRHAALGRRRRGRPGWSRCRSSRRRAGRLPASSTSARDLGVGADAEQATRRPAPRPARPRSASPARTSTSKPVAAERLGGDAGGCSPAAVPSRDDTLGGDGTPASLRPGGRAVAG